MVGFAFWQCRYQDSVDKSLAVFGGDALNAKGNVSLSCVVFYMYL